MSNLWKWIVVGAVLGGIGGYMSSSKAQDVWSVPNFNNSPMNFNATNGVYDSSGNRIGYTTVSPQGVSNIFGNDGNRIGYAPAPTPSTLVPLR